MCCISTIYERISVAKHECRMYQRANKVIGQYNIQEEYPSTADNVQVRYPCTAVQHQQQKHQTRI